MLARFSNPVDDCILFVLFGPCQTADSTSFRDQGQRVEHLTFWRAATIEERAFGLRERPAAGFALVALTTRFGLAILDDVLLPFPLALPTV